MRPPMPDAIELRIGADTRRTTGESRELYSFSSGEPTRRRFAGGESWTAGAFTEATAQLGAATLTAGARLDHWAIGDGHLFEKTIATNAVLTDVHDASRDGWLPTCSSSLLKP